MTTINKLSSVDAVASSDQFPLYSASNGDARKCSFALMTSAVSDALQPELNAILTAMFAALPTTLPAASGVVWNNGGVICIS
jgi:hypothetical protein